MKLRSSHIAAAALCAVAAFVFFAVYRTPTPQVSDNGGPAAPAPANAAPSASLPPIGADQEAVAVIAVDTADFDLGTIPNDRESTFPFTLHNRGKAPLHIMDVRSSCACTRGAMPAGREVIPPGQSTAMNITVFPDRIAGFESRKTLSIMSNDAMHPSMEVRVTARIEPEFDLLPQSLEFGPLNKGESPQRTILLRQRADYPIVLTELQSLEKEKSAPADFRIAFSKRPENEWAAPGKAEYEITVSIEPFAPPGPFIRRFNIGTNIKRYPWVPYTIQAEISAPYTVKPAYPGVAVLRLSEGKMAAKIQLKGNVPLTISDVSIEPPMFNAVPLPETLPEAPAIEIVPVPGAPQGPVSAVLWYTVNAGQEVFRERGFVRGTIGPQQPPSS